jgi:DNA gyrase/topoisomerase IV subunit A
MTDHKLLIFTDMGNCYLLPVLNIPECRYKERGMPLNGLLAGLEKSENIVSAMSMPPDIWQGDLIFVTAGGMAKRTALSEYNVRKSRTAALKLRESDALLCVIRPESAESLLLISESGMSIHFPLEQVPAMGRVSAGVKCMSLAPGDRVARALPGGAEGEILLITDCGYTKRCLMVDFDLQARGGKGVRAYYFNKNGSNGTRVACALAVRKPFDFAVRQKSGSMTKLNTEQVKIELKSGKGQMYVLVALGDVVIDAFPISE